MIKRYTPKNMTWDHPKFEMLENEAGEWVRYDDHQEIMESIGAGGVSGRITNKTIEDHRAEFEEAVERHYSVYWCDREKSYMSVGGIQALIYQSKWQGWLAAKGVKE